jgi:coenzyme F420-reducing hydrogenase delta subunit
MEKTTGGKIAVYVCENSGLKAAYNCENREILSAAEILRLPCSGKIETAMLLKTFEAGYSAVVVFGCPEENCKFLSGNLRARKRTEAAKRSLSEAGLDPDLLAIDYISSMDAHKFEKTLRSMGEKIGLWQSAEAPSGPGKGEKA